MKPLPRALILLLSTLLQPAPVSGFWPFANKRFKGNALIQAGTLGLDKSVGRIIAFGDFDGNQLCAPTLSVLRGFCCLFSGVLTLVSMLCP